MSALGALAARLRRRSTPPAATAEPLLDPAELARLAALARHWPLAVRQFDVHEHHAGDWSSTASGRGLDFEESRPYAPGDDLRDMDWRSTARLGHPFVKTYREERQPIWHLVVDHGPGMRFGTRRRIKAAQAARLAVLLAHVAHHHGIAVGGSVWNGSDVLLPASHGEAGLLALVRALNAPCPPQPFDADHGDPAARLRRLRAEVPRGAEVWLLTDAHTLDEAAWKMLALLADATRVRFVRIFDASERALPDLGLVAFDGGASAPRWIDTADTATREALTARWQAERAGQDARLARLGLRAIDLDAARDELLPLAHTPGTVA